MPAQFAETIEWLNNNVLVGNEAQRGKVWHFDPDAQGDESNHYQGAIPIEDVDRRLFNFQATLVPTFYGEPVRDEDGNYQYDGKGELIVVPVLDPERRHVVASDNDDRFSVVSKGWRPHQYSEWLLGNVGNILDDDLVISSAGLLKGRAVAWVEVSVPDTQEVNGVQFRPNLLATTSMNQTVSTTYMRTITGVVCGNTWNAALSEAGPKIKYRHSKNSELRVAEAREALDIIWSTRDEMSEAIRRLTDATLTDSQWEILLKTVIPMPGTDSPKGRTQATHRREKIDLLYRSDERATPWNGTMFGAYQSMNLYQTWERGVKGDTVLPERVMWDTVRGNTEKLDAPMINAIDAMMAGDLVTLPAGAE